LKPLKTKEGDIIVSKEEKHRCAEVLGVGDEVKDISVGDTVYFKSGLSYREILIDGEELLTCTTDDIFGFKAN
jgi:co-chaperonin GroES (HSP10)